MGITEFQIRKTHESDIAEILDIERMSFTTPWSEAAFLNEIYHPHAISKVAVFENRVIGYIFARQILSDCHILNLAVHPRMRKRGIGTSLVEEVLAELKEQRCTFLYLEVRASNMEARKFYERFGFRPVGIRKNYYILPKEDAVVMVHQL